MAPKDLVATECDSRMVSGVHEPPFADPSVRIFVIPPAVRSVASDMASKNRAPAVHGMGVVNEPVVPS